MKRVSGRIQPKPWHCANCGKEFWPQRRNQRNCSPVCRNRNAQKRLRDRARINKETK